MPAAAASRQTDAAPSRGTMLIPLTPKIDTTPPASRATSPAPQAQPQVGSVKAEQGLTGSSASGASTGGRAEGTADLLKPAEKISPEEGNVEADNAEGSDIAEGTTLKGSIQMVADDTEYDQQKNTFLGTGNAVVYIGGQDAKLEADTILYDQNNQTIDARGGVRIFRGGQVTTGSAFKFNIASDEYLITRPDTEVQGTTVVARKGMGSKTGMAFRDGTMQMPTPVHLANNAGFGPLGAAETFLSQQAHPDAYLPSQPSFKFKARKIIYEKYKEQNNITIFGGKLMFGNFGVPLPPRMVLTGGTKEMRAVMPITPLLCNNMQMGGTSLGPQFNYSVGRNGVFSWAPLLQLGGSRVPKDDPNHHSIGAGVRLGYVSDKVVAHMAYGSNSNMLVAEYKYRFNDHWRFVSGVNRYLEDGIFGYNRARLRGELVYKKGIGNVPFMQSVNFYSSAGVAQDNPALLNQTPDLKGLYNLSGNPGKVFGFRIQQQVTAISQPIFSIGDSLNSVKMYFYGGAGGKAYSTGDTLGLIQAGPVLDTRLNRLRLQLAYTQSGEAGKSPFVFDQFIQGTKSTTVNGDIRVCKYLTLGGQLGYNLDAKALYQKTLKLAVGPDDFKFLFSYDTLTGYERFGFNILCGSPVNYDRLVLKAGPDTGKLGGI